MAAIFKPLRGSRLRAACGASCAAQCVVRFWAQERSALAPSCVELGPGDCASSKGRSGCFRCVFSVLIPLSNSYSVLIPVLIPVLIHGFAGRATRHKLSVNRF